MNSKTRRLFLVPLILLAALLLAAPATAQAIRTDFTAWDIPGALSGGRTWMEDGFLYMRDLQFTSQIYQATPAQDLGFAGLYAAEMNANVDLISGCGHIWGKARNPGWRISYEGQICIDLLGNPVSFTTRGVGHGLGDMKGLQIRYQNVNGFMTGYILETGGQ